MTFYGNVRVCWRLTDMPWRSKTKACYALLVFRVADIREGFESAVSWLLSSQHIPYILFYFPNCVVRVLREALSGAIYSPLVSVFPTPFSRREYLDTKRTKLTIFIFSFNFFLLEQHLAGIFISSSFMLSICLLVLWKKVWDFVDVKETAWTFGARQLFGRYSLVLQSNKSH